jgi:hypothetical protein
MELELIGNYRGQSKEGPFHIKSASNPNAFAKEMHRTVEFDFLFRNTDGGK